MNNRTYALAAVLDDRWTTRKAIALRLGKRKLTQAEVATLDALVVTGHLERRTVKTNAPVARAEYRAAPGVYFVLSFGGDAASVEVRRFTVDPEDDAALDAALASLDATGAVKVQGPYPLDAAYTLAGRYAEDIASYHDPYAKEGTDND